MIHRSFAFCVVVLLAGFRVGPLAARSDVPPYTSVGTIPFVVDGQVLRTFVFDPGANRLYAGSDRGLFWTDLGDPSPRLKGPMFKRDIRKIQFAPDLGRLFYTTDDEVGYADVRTGGEPTALVVDFHATDLTYEPTRHELYVSSRDPRLLIFDAKSPERGTPLELPGWYGLELEAIPGRVFLSVGGKDGLYTIDAATHRVSEWPVTGRISTPAYLEADPSGQYLFLAYYREIVAIDIAKAAVVGRVVTATVPAIAFDPGTRLLVATWNDDPPPTRVIVYRVDDHGLSTVAQLKNPDVGEVGVEPMNGGFVQAGHHALILWRSRASSALPID